MSTVKHEGPFYGCAIEGCSDECTYPADMLRVHEGLAWCEGCWDDAPITWLDEDCEEFLQWSDLPKFIPDHEKRIAALESQLKQFVDLAGESTGVYGYDPAGGWGKERWDDFDLDALKPVENKGTQIND